ncbi:MAG: S1C family serine protease [Gemmatimonadaceae bacterium]
MRLDAFAPLSADLSAAADALRRVTVQVTAGRRGGGAGVVWRPDGLLVTNAHVVGDAARVRVRLPDGREAEARVADRDDRADLAALQLDARGMDAARLGAAAALRPGELVLAFGHPLGVSDALAVGVVHGVSRRAPGAPPRWVRADVRLAPGNSGGPLADARGRVVGVNAMIARGLGVAVAAEAVVRFLAGPAVRPALGVQLRPVLVGRGVAARLGLLVLETTADGAAARAGLAPGDVVLAVDGEPLAHPGALADRLLDAAEGEVLRLELLRGGRAVTRDVAVRAPARRAA